MRFRSVAPLVALSSLLLVTPVTAAVKVVEIKSSAFLPATAAIAQGDEVSFQNKDEVTHTVTRTKFPAFGQEVTSNDSDSITFTQAGAFAYRCTIHSGMTGTVNVRVKAAPTSGTKTTTFTITVAAAAAPAGSHYIIQRKAPGGTFQAWRTSTAPSVTFKSATKGTWRFRSRVAKVSSGVGAAFSPVASVTIG